jgi:hypothetical protein
MNLSIDCGVLRVLELLVVQEADGKLCNDECDNNDSDNLMVRSEATGLYIVSNLDPKRESAPEVPTRWYVKLVATPRPKPASTMIMATVWFTAWARTHPPNLSIKAPMGIRAQIARIINTAWMVDLMSETPPLV